MNIPTGSIKTRLLQLALEVDTKGARLVLMLASLVWTVLLFWPGDGFERPIYAPMKAMAEDTTWGLFFMLHFSATLYSSFLAVRNRTLMILEGVLGLTLYSISLLSVIAAISGPAPLFAPYVACVIAALWVLVRYPENK